MKEKKKHLDGDVIDCCKEPPHSCPRRYCSIAFRSFEKHIGLPVVIVVVPKKKSPKKLRKKVKHVD